MEWILYMVMDTGEQEYVDTFDSQDEAEEEMDNIDPDGEIEFHLYCDDGVCRVEV